MQMKKNINVLLDAPLDWVKTLKSRLLEQKNMEIYLFTLVQSVSKMSESNDRSL